MALISLYVTLFRLPEAAIPVATFQKSCVCAATCIQFIEYMSSGTMSAV